MAAKKFFTSFFLRTFGLPYCGQKSSLQSKYKKAKSRFITPHFKGEENERHFRKLLLPGLFFAPPSFTHIASRISPFPFLLFFCSLLLVLCVANGGERTGGHQELIIPGGGNGGSRDTEGGWKNATLVQKAISREKKYRKWTEEKRTDGSLLGKSAICISRDFDRKRETDGKVKKRKKGKQF